MLASFKVSSIKFQWSLSKAFSKSTLIAIQPVEPCLRLIEYFLSYNDVVSETSPSYEARLKGKDKLGHYRFEPVGYDLRDDLI